VRVFEVVHGSSTVTTLASFDTTIGTIFGDSTICQFGGNIFVTEPSGGLAGLGAVLRIPAL
jgi:hypothetical protein